jgi:hypothetical protein
MGFLEFTKGWLPELVSSSLSVISLVCLVLVLRIYNGRPLTDLDLPPYLTLNTVVALIATINSACLTAPICAALMQEMWIKYLDKIERNKDCQLRDMVRFYDASNGVIGSLMFLFKLRSWEYAIHHIQIHGAQIAILTFCSGFVAFWGCLITILSLGYSAFTQQLVGIELQARTTIGNLPRSEVYDTYYDRPWDGEHAVHT